MRRVHLFLVIGGLMGLWACGSPETTGSTSIELNEFVDTEAGNSLSEDDSLFEVTTFDGETVLKTSSTATNIHSHLDNGATYSNIEFSGKMRITDPDGGIGVTFLSQYPDADEYYRLRRHEGSGFHLAPHGTSACQGQASGVTPAANTWYRFKVVTDVQSDRTRLSVKVWESGTTEPDGYQITCEDTSADRLQEGTIGVWAMGPGEKLWADFRLAFDPFLGTSVDDDSTTVMDAGTDSVSDGGMDSSTEDGGDECGPGELALGDFVDTEAGNSLQTDDTLFQVVTENGEQLLTTSSTDVNIHSHLVDGTSYSNMEFSGKMRMSDPDGGLGVTFLSKYPNEDAYYRVRRYGGSGGFHTAPHGGAGCDGQMLGVSPQAGTWYRFRIRTTVQTDRTVIETKVWPSDETEPSSYQVTCEDTSSGRLTSGTVGVWSMGPGDKSWGDLRLVAGSTDSGSDTGETSDAGTDDGTSDGIDSGTDDGTSDGTDSGATEGGAYDHVTPADVGQDISTGVVGPEPTATYDGPTTITTPGTVIEDVVIDANLRIEADDVTVRNVRLTGTFYPVQVKNGARNFTFEYSELNCTSPSKAFISFNGMPNATIRHNEVIGCEDFFYLLGDIDGMLVKNNYMHSLVGESSSHADGFQLGTNGTTSGHVTLVGNYFDPDAPDVGQTGLVFNSDGSTVQWTIESNFIEPWGYYTLRCGAGAHCDSINNVYGAGFQDGERIDLGSVTHTCDRYADGTFVTGVDNDTTDCPAF